MATNFDDNINFRTTTTFNGVSCSQAASLSGIAFSGYSTNGGVPLRSLTDASTPANVISFVKTLAEDILKTK